MRKLTLLNKKIQHITQLPTRSDRLGGALDVQIKDGLIHITAGSSYMGFPITCGDPMTSLEAEKLADELRAAARKLRNKDQRKKLGDY